ncbi:Mediator of RNA polymerase II transcription subunit 7 [Escovopsis weberi]|uniref:Mediator of RNA polymerase II transcription subunit 7 n=1 Tax=Escovopsis weberi TaxID=150374 RepID=A0A0M9VWL7_ESCWE|nr:Mediator of RNA polymerase II transcription subunit 7 [Escovopsis weberi]
MAEQEPHGLASTFPNPPPFWQDFTPENVAKMEGLHAAYLRSHPGLALDAAPLRVPDVPEDLACLQPPAEPADGKWRVFGDHYMLNDQLPTLEEQGIQNLPASGPSGAKDPTNYDRAFELKRMAKSILLNFLELAGVLAHNPPDAEAKIADIRTVFINMHHILNEYRPHQARESAIEMMQSHLEKTQAETIAIRSQVEKARRVLEGLGSLPIASLYDGGGEGAAAAAAAAGGDARIAELRLRREADVWAATDVLFA